MPDLGPIDFERASENLRQERETFDQRKRQDNRWFLLRLAMGYSSIVLLTSIMVFSAWVLLRAKDFAPSVVASAGAALFGDVLGLLISVWKIALNPNFTTKLAPVTQAVKISGGKRQADVQVT